MPILSGIPVEQEDVALFYVPDNDFNPARNQAIINEVLEENKQAYKAHQQKTKDQMGERVEVLTSYIMHLVTKNDTTSLDKYIGKRYLTQLRGERLAERIKRVGRQNGYLL